MNEGIRKFRELLLTDEEFQKKLREAAAAYTGERTEETVFTEILSPLAAEYGISATFDEFHSFINDDHEMESEELAQVAAGKTSAQILDTCTCLGTIPGMPGTYENACPFCGIATTICSTHGGDSL